jgi:dephospho-CoA kinase
MKTRVALAGFMGSGKSTAAKVLISHGYTVYDGDKMAKEMMQSSAHIKHSLVTEFGTDIIAENSIQFPLLANKVFTSLSTFKMLNSIVHPPFKQYLTTFLEKQQTPWILDAAVLPLLWPAHELFDCFIWITSNTTKREDRIISRTQLSRESVRNRMLMQEQTIPVPAENSWITLENNDSPESLFKALFSALGIVSGDVP